tara:strand:+ start:5443 stop:8487 length:3045 start_codon:yes stop_codon:yes gene_type:complete
MAEKKFKFVSPGVFLQEIDNSALPETGQEIGPVVIGRTARGPALRPVTVNSFSEFVTVFGEPQAGGKGNDVWRDGDTLAPTPAAYAAQAWLRNNSPITVMRLLGDQSNNPSSEGYAGWGGANKTSPVNFGSVAQYTAGGAYGLFVMNSSSAKSGVTGQDAVLAAVLYTNSTNTVALSGSCLSGSSSNFVATASQGVVFKTNDDGNFVLSIGTIAQIATPNEAEKIEFNFNRNDDKYIRKVLNTDPTRLNTEITSDTKNYFLGETFDTALRTGSIGDTKLAAGITNRTMPEPNLNVQNTGLSSQADINRAFLVGLETQTGNNWSDHAFETKDARTGWIIGQDLGAAENYVPDNQQKLFRLVGLNQGAWIQNNLKVSIESIRPASNNSNDYGTFSVTLRRIEDNDKAPVVVERFSNCNLNPNSVDYIARKIGDKNIAWDNTEKRIREYGDYNNQSKFVRVEMNSAVDNGAVDARLLPFGFFGTPAWRGMIRISGNIDNQADARGTTLNNVILRANNDIAHYPVIFLNNSSSAFVVKNIGGPNASPISANPSVLTASYYMPVVPLRINAKDGDMASFTDAYFGVHTGRSGSYNTYEESTVDLLRAASADLDVDSNVSQTVPYIFSLDNLSGSLDEGAVYVSGSRNATAANRSLSARYGFGAVLTGSTLNSGLGHIGGFNRFTCLFHGGFDGLDITERDAFRNNAFVASPTGDNDYRFHSIKRAIDTLRDPEFVEYNLATIPGITNSTLTSHLIDTCEERADAMAIIDLEGDYVPRTENTSTAAVRRPDVTETVRNLKLRNINSSYAAAYFPYVQIRDTNTAQLVDIPASVVALGTISNSERKKALWFAPAGFTRGGLSEGAAGLPVVGVKHQLTAKERDDLYGANINPIATFPAEGIVVFGQKTLQVTPSALDRVNVRRLLIFIKKQVSRIAATTLFEQNVQATWDRFSNRVESLLSGIKAAQGLEDFRVILDSSTTTPELIDRNIMYAKVFLKPARAIEFVALDFTVTDSGAAFDD